MPMPWHIGISLCDKKSLACYNIGPQFVFAVVNVYHDMILDWHEMIYMYFCTGYVSSGLYLDIHYTPVYWCICTPLYDNNIN